MKRDISLAHDFKSLMEWLRVIRRVRPQVINLGTPKASLLGGIAAWWYRVPHRIYTVRGLRLEGTSGFIARILWFVERATIGMATEIIAVSPSLGKKLVDFKLASPGDIWIIGSGSSNGVDAHAIQKRSAQVDESHLRQQLGIDSSGFIVGYIGRVTQSKGIEVLLDSLKAEELAGKVTLLIIGAIEDKELGEAIEEMGGRVHVLPWTDDVWAYLSAIDVLVLPTLREGFPNVVIEAAAAGIPSITTRATGAVDSVKDGETGFLIDVGDGEALVDRLNLLVQDSKLLHRLGENAKRRVEDQFRPPDIWQGIEALALGNHESNHVKRLDDFLESRELS